MYSWRLKWNMKTDFLWGGEIPVTEKKIFHPQNMLTHSIKLLFIEKSMIWNYFEFYCPHIPHKYLLKDPILFQTQPDGIIEHLFQRTKKLGGKTVFSLSVWLWF